MKSSAPSRWRASLQRAKSPEITFWTDRHAHIIHIGQAEEAHRMGVYKHSPTQAASNISERAAYPEKPAPCGSSGHHQGNRMNGKAIKTFTAKGTKVRKGGQKLLISFANLCEPLRNFASFAVNLCFPHESGPFLQFMRSPWGHHKVTSISLLNGASR